MIKASQILEEYEKICTTFFGEPAKKYTIFKNPTLKEIREAEQEGGDEDPEVRFIADNATKDVYVFSAFIANHFEARDCLNLKCMSKLKNNYVCGSQLDGTAKRHGSILIMTESDMMWGIAAEKEYREIILSQDWSWVEKHVRVSDYLENIRKRYGLGK